MEAQKLKTAVIGASGFAGGETCRLLLGHRHIDAIHPVSRGTEPFEAVHPNLAGCGLEFDALDSVADGADALDVVFFCTPSGEAMKLARHFLSHHVRVIDLSADFRFSDPQRYERVHGRTHTDTDSLKNAVYGVSELYPDEIANARLVANPGCYVITALLALAPVIRSEICDLSVPLDLFAINGTSGAGSKPRTEIMHAHANDNILPYNLSGHRHAPELEDQLSRIAQTNIRVTFSTAHGSFSRGIHLQANLRPSSQYLGRISRESLIAVYKDFYGQNGDGHPFVVTIDNPDADKLNAKQYDIYPNVARVTGSNRCHIGMDYDRYADVIKVVGVTDNLVKGAAGSAIQNMNLMFGFDETEGLAHYGL